MAPVARIQQAAICWLIPSVLLALASGTSAADAPAPAPQAAAAAGSAQAASVVLLSPNAAAVIGKSALLTVQGTASSNALLLRILRNADKSLITAEGVTVTLGGKSQSVSQRADGYEIPLDDLPEADARNPGKELEVVVPHDGIREIVSGQVALAEGKSTGESLLRDHRQIAWWIVNIVVVLIAALAISRRKG